MSARRIVIGALAFSLSLLHGAAYADGVVVDVDSSLDPWSLRAQELINGGSGKVHEVDALPCGLVYQEIRAYNDTDEETLEALGLTTYVTSWNLSDSEIADLIALADSSFDAANVRACTTIWADGWLPADDEDLAFIDDPGALIEINVDGEPVACDYGEILLVSATRYFRDGGWQFFKGRDWEEVPYNGVMASGDYSFMCQPLIDPTADLVEVADAVPTTQSLHNPLLVGLTGLETWYWYDFTTPESSEITVTANVDSLGSRWAITATAWVDQVWWEPDCVADCTWRGMLSDWEGEGFDDGLVLDLPDSVSSPATIYDGGAGTEDARAAAYLYETKGDYTMATATVWRGISTFQGISTPYAPVLVIDSVPFTVCELVGVLTTPGETPELNTCPVPIP